VGPEVRAPSGTWTPFFDEDARIIEVIGVLFVVGVFTGLLFLEIVGQEGRDQFPEFHRIVPVFLPGQPRSQPFSRA
jgi:hypothetical protein